MRVTIQGIIDDFNLITDEHIYSPVVTEAIEEITGEAVLDEDEYVITIERM